MISVDDYDGEDCIENVESLISAQQAMMLPISHLKTRLAPVSVAVHHAVRIPVAPVLGVYLTEWGRSPPRGPNSCGTCFGFVLAPVLVFGTCFLNDTESCI